MRGLNNKLAKIYLNFSFTFDYFVVVVFDYNSFLISNIEIQSTPGFDQNQTVITT